MLLKRIFLMILLCCINPFVANGNILESSVSIAASLGSNTTRSAESKIAKRIFKGITNGVSAVWKEFEKDPETPIVKDGELKSVCTEPVNDSRYECIDYFKDLKTQEATAYSLAQAYMEYQLLYRDLPNKTTEPQDKIHSRCQTIPTVDRKTGTAYFACKATRNNKDYYYDFKFKNMKGYDNDVIYGSFERLCTLLGYKYIDNTRTCADFTDSRNTCIKRLDHFLKPFGLNVFANQTYGGCTVEDVVIKDENKLKNEISEKLNPKIFSTFQIKFTKNTHKLIEQYVMNVLNNPSDLAVFGASKWSDLNFRCGSAFRKIVIDSSNTDNALRCSITNLKSNTEHSIDFIFDDATEGWKYAQEAADAAFGCLGSNGVYENAKCHGLGNSECAKLGAELEKQGKQGTVYENGLCVLKGAQLEAEIRKDAQTLGVVVGGVLVVASIPGSGGATLVIAVASAGAYATSLGITLYQEATADAINKSAGECMKKTDKQQKHECAKIVLKDIMGKDFAEWNINEEKKIALDEATYRLIRMLDPQQIDIPEEVNNLLANKDSDISVKINNVAEWVGVIGIVAGFGVQAIDKYWKTGTKLPAMTKSIAGTEQLVKDAATAKRLTQQTTTIAGFTGAKTGKELIKGTKEITKNIGKLTKKTTNIAGKGKKVVQTVEKTADLYGKEQDVSDVINKGKELVTEDENDIPLRLLYIGG